MLKRNNMKTIYMILATSMLSMYTHPQNMVVTVPIASIRTAPVDYHFGKEHNIKASRNAFGRSYELFIKTLSPEFRDPAQNTQALYNENIICLEKLKNGWLKVLLTEQYSYCSNKKCFDHIVGYIKDSQVKPVAYPYKSNLVVIKPWAAITLQDGTTLTIPMGTKLLGTKKKRNHCLITLPDGRTGTIKTSDMYYLKKRITDSKTSLRSAVVSCAQQLVGGPYCWGGRSPYCEDITECAPSCDCSGLITMAYRAGGLELPRNSHAMWLASAKIKRASHLKPGDLIFFAYPDRKDHVNHVLMYLGNDLVIESCITKGIAIHKTQARFGKPVAKLTYGDIIKSPGSRLTKYVIYFGSFLGDRTRMQYMRNNALGNYDINRLGKR